MKNTILILTLLISVIWIPFSGNSQLSQNDVQDSITVEIDSLGIYYRVPFKRAQAIAWKASFFPQFLQCKEEIAGITSQYLTTFQKVDSLNKKLEGIVVNNDYLVQKTTFDQTKIKDLEDKAKTSKFWHWVKDIVIGGLLAFSISKL